MTMETCRTSDPLPAKLNASVCPAPFEKISLPDPPEIKVEVRRQKIKSTKRAVYAVTTLIVEGRGEAADKPKTCVSFAGSCAASILIFLGCADLCAGGGG